MTRKTIPLATARRLNDRSAVLLIDTDCIEQVFPRGVAETMANAWNAAAEWCHKSGAPHEVPMRRTLILAGHEADVTLVVGYVGDGINGDDVSLVSLRAYDESDHAPQPLVLPAQIRAAIFEDEEIYEACLDAWRALREHDRELAMAGG